MAATRHALSGGRDTSPRLLDLLGDTRAKVVEFLRGGDRSVADLAAEIGLSEVAVRRHLQILESEGFVSAATVRRDVPGRPAARYSLTAKAYRLFPDRSAEFANDLLDYVESEHGRPALLAFLRSRQDAQAARYSAALGAAGDDLTEQVRGLARLLSEDGFDARAGEVTAPDGSTVLQLVQSHCAIKDVASEHPEVCAYEAALFKRLLGKKLSRRQTIAGGSHECVCEIPSGRTPTNQAPTSDGTTIGARDGDQS